MLQGKHRKARRPECLKESGMFPYARAIHRAILMIYKTLYKILQTQDISG